MAFQIEGDGSHKNTKIWHDGELIKVWEGCRVVIDENGCRAVVSTNECKDCQEWQPITRMIISGIYVIISEGQFSNSRIFINEEMLRGVQSLIMDITRGQHPTIRIVSVLLPNLVEEVPEAPPPKVDPRLVTYAEKAPKRKKEK